MLSITECVKKIREGRKAEIKAQIIQNLYGIFLSNAQIGLVEGNIDVEYEEDREFDLALEATKELLENDFDFQRYVELEDRFLEDKEIILEFNLEKPFKVVDSEPKVCNNGYAEEDIPF